MWSRRGGIHLRPAEPRVPPQHCGIIEARPHHELPHGSGATQVGTRSAPIVSPCRARGRTARRLGARGSTITEGEQCGSGFARCKPLGEVCGGPEHECVRGVCRCVPTRTRSRVLFFLLRVLCMRRQNVSLVRVGIKGRICLGIKHLRRERATSGERRLRRLRDARGDSRQGFASKGE